MQKGFEGDVSLMVTVFRDRSRYTRSEQLFILDNHPFFTGICPQCRHKFEQDNLPVYFDCPECDFIDDSV